MGSRGEMRVDCPPKTRIGIVKPLKMTLKV